MTKLLALIPGLLLLALFGCTETEDPTQTESPPPAPLQFSQAADPKAFFADYWEDLSGERFLPEEMQKMYVGRTPLPQTLAMMREHNTMAFIEGYYTREYVQSLRERDAKELAQMDYQLDIMDVKKEDAADVLLLADSAPLTHKTQMLKGEVARSWDKIDENTWEVTLSRQDWRQRVLVVKEGESWQLTLPNAYGPSRSRPSDQGGPSAE